MIELRQVNKSFHHQGHSQPAIIDATFTVNTNEILGIIGKSGAGKSTLLRTINLLSRPDDGEVWVNQQNLCALSANELTQARRRIGMIFQQFNLLQQKTVADNIALPLQLQRIDPALIEQRVTTLLNQTGLTAHRHHYPHQLSGGQKQRVAIARALANQPSVLLCDEATSALDPHTARHIINLIKQLQRDLQLCVVFITHDIELIRDLADRVIVINQGRIVEQNDTNSLLTQPKTAFTRELIAAHSTPGVAHAVNQ